MVIFHSYVNVYQRVCFFSWFMLVPQRDKLLQGTTLPDWGYEELKAKFQATAWWKDGTFP
jgi:hypothetical protein